MFSALPEADHDNTHQFIINTKDIQTFFSYLLSICTSVAFFLFSLQLMNLEGYPYMGSGESSAIDSRFSVHYLVMVHAGSLENTKEAPRMASGAAESSFSFLSALQTLRLQTFHNSMMRSLRHESITL